MSIKKNDSGTPINGYLSETDTLFFSGHYNTYDPNDFFTKTFTMSRITPRNNMLK